MKSGKNKKKVVKLKMVKVKSGHNEVVKMKICQNEKWSKLKGVKMKSGQNEK